VDKPLILRTDQIFGDRQAEFQMHSASDESKLQHGAAPRRLQRLVTHGKELPPALRPNHESVSREVLLYL
jgi:hypothetical protein